MEDNRKVFLLSMKINGIKNIEKDIEINFYKDTIAKNFKSDKFNIKGIYGENGVGKSGLMTGAYIFKELLTNPSYLNNSFSNEKIAYLINYKTNKALLEFEYLEQDESINIYKIGFEIVRNINGVVAIEHEYAYRRKPNSNYKLLYEVNDGELIYNSKTIFKKYITELTKNIIKERSFISAVANSIIDGQYKEDMYDIERIIGCGYFTYVYIDIKDMHDDYVDPRVAFRLMKNENKNIIISKPLNHLTCIGDVNVPKDSIKQYRNEIKGLSKFIKIFKPELKEIEIKEMPDKDRIVCELIFVYKNYKVAGEFESTGIKRLVELYNAFKCVSEGYIVFIDELDANIHDYYLCKLLEYVGKYSSGQLCFTTHNLGPMRVLKDYKKSIDFISRDGSIVQWIKNGNYDVSSLYKQGKIEKSPFNIESFDFLSVFEGNE